MRRRPRSTIDHRVERGAEVMVQTFLPYADFGKSVRCLDVKRLGKQRVEVWQLLRALRGESRGWVSHPATLMWRGYEEALAIYGSCACEEWIGRGYQDSLLVRFAGSLTGGPAMLPDWFGNEAFHASHRSNLLRKLPEHYSKFGWVEPDDLPYLWPRSNWRFP